MAATMKAAFTLTLEDKMSSAMKNIGHGLEDLKKVGSELNLGKLGQNGAELLRTVGQEVRSLTSELRTIEAVADRSWAAMKRMASVSFHNVANAGRSIATVGKQTLGQGGLIGAAEAVGGAYALLRPAQDYARFENINRHSAITEGFSGPAADAESKRLMRMSNRDALDTGQSSESISQAYQELIQLGMKPATAEKLLPIHSRAATAYNMTTEALGPAVFALSDTFKIGEEDMPGALASMALAAKSGRFKVEDFAHALPGLAGTFASYGMTGRKSADVAFAAIETVMRNAGEAGTGAANLKQFMNMLSSPTATRAFLLQSKGMPKPTREAIDQYHIQGINLPKLRSDARKKGIDPLTATLEALHKVTDRLPPDVQRTVLGAFMGNDQERDAAMSLLSHPGEYNELLGQLHGADRNLSLRDYETAHAGPLVTQNTGMEAATQLERRAGEGFEPIVDRLTAAGKGLVGTVESLDQKMPGLADAVLNVTGSLVALGSALAAIGFIAPAIGKGAAIAGMALSPSALLLGGPLAGAGVAIASGQHPEQYPLADPSTETMFPLAPPDTIRPPVNLTTPMPDDSYGFPRDARPAAPAAPAELVVRLDAGLLGNLTRPSPNSIIRLDPGNTTQRP